MKVKVITSQHNDVPIGAIGEAKSRPDLGGWEVTLVPNQLTLHHKDVSQPATYFFTQAELNFRIN